MATNLLWFVLAGFLIGFATSTLWEWFYFRKERLKLTDRRIRELEAKLRAPETAAESIPPTNTPATSAPPPNSPLTRAQMRSAALTSAPSTSTSPASAPLTSWWNDPAYRSPGVFLESEEYDADGIGNSLIGTESAPRAATTGANSSSAISATATPEPSSETAFMPRNEQSPADALRARRGDTPRSRQEVLAALRRNSEPALRGQPLPETEQPQRETFPQPTQTAGSPTPPPENEEPRTTALAAPTLTAPPAQAQTHALSDARQKWLNNPDLTRRTQEYPDDLSKIKGIGDVYKQRLYRAGIYTWKQIAEADVETLRRATSAYPSSNVDEWLVQAQNLMEKHGRADAVYSGPQPDDLTKILGIGPVGAAVLYRAGICTYEQLASTSVAELEALFPVAVAGDQPDFSQWMARAANLADTKYDAK